MIDKLVEAGLPESQEAERMVLGSVLAHHAQFDTLAAALEADDFSSERHRRMFARMADLSARGESINRMTLWTELENNSQAEHNGFTYVCSLDEQLPEIVELDSFVRIVQEKSTLRRAALLAQQIMNRCLLADGRSSEILADAEMLLSKLGQKQQSADQWLNPGEVIHSYPGGINGFFAENRGGLGISTPWPTLTRRLCGLGKGELVVLAGRPSMGKSIVAMQLAHQAAKEGHGAAFFSLEMTRENLTDRLISAVGGLDYRRLRERKLDADERLVAARATREIWDLPLRIDDGRSRSVPAITSALRKLITKQPVRLVLVDYVQLMRSTGRPESRREGVSEISHSMKHLASEFGVTVVLLSQLNRECEIEKRQPRLSDLSESGALEHDADIVLFIDRPEMRDKRDPSLKGLAEFIVGKQRNGPTGKIHMRFQGEYQRFVESTDRNEESRGEAA